MLRNRARRLDCKIMR
ncbi:hypothetical protein MLY81_05975 [Escherichia coli]|nr:hypothetical protein [Escherichia coli]